MVDVCFFQDMVAMAIALLTVSCNPLKSAMTNPVKNLRTE